MTTITLGNYVVKRLNELVQEVTECDQRLTKAETQRLVNDMLLNGWTVEEAVLEWAAEAEAA